MSDTSLSGFLSEPDLDNVQNTVLRQASFETLKLFSRKIPVANPEPVAWRLKNCHDVLAGLQDLCFKPLNSRL